MDASPLEWANFWATVVGTVATIAALAIAIVLGLHEVRAIRRENRERDDDRRLREARRARAQAESVSAVLHVDAKATFDKNFAPRYHTWVNVANGSSLPIYDVQVHVPNEGVHPGRLQVASTKIVAGGQVEHLHSSLHVNHNHDGDPVDVWFRDAAGQHWHRAPDGHLHELDSSGVPGPDDYEEAPA